MKIENLWKIAIAVLLSMAILCIPATAVPISVWNGNEDLEPVDLEPGYFIFTPTHDNSNNYYYPWMSDVGAFYAASQRNIGNFDYNVTDFWYDPDDVFYGSFYVHCIDGVCEDYVNDTAWFMYINGEYAEYGFGDERNKLSEFDVVQWYYAPYTYEYKCDELIVAVDKANATHYLGLLVV
ncbi:DUF4430 domain-containing protein [uncultured Methanolobus sp.]|uniref:DUF4430 domain-containing protein n=1 Tax=uncultured Methanolobus sp. TaxID=218300 RepID=UPI002AABD00D|nr:DUF4430 domain-containing protein [uncultured Methanolobus sp.]